MSSPSSNILSLTSRLRLREFPLLLTLVGLIILFSRLSPGFFNNVNLAAIGRDTAVMGILGIGLTLVVITGGIDLSCASILALSASMMGILMRDTGGILLPITVCLLLSVALGAGNSLLVVVFKVPPIIATLATLSLYRMQAIRAVSLISPLPSGYTALGSGWGAFAVLIALLAMAMALLHRTRWGRHLYAVGGNAAAARLSGVRMGLTVGLAYIGSGFAAGAAALVASASLNSVQGNMFMGYELDAVAAVVIGGTAMTGGRGGALGTVLGASIMATLRNGLVIAGLDVFWYKTIIGVAILLVAGLDRVMRREPPGVGQAA